jgi:hypothetical protein
MGMVYYLRAISAQRLSEVQEGSDAASAFLFGDLGAEAGAEPPGLVCLDKSWHAIHYLLTGAIDGGSWPECFLLQGGTMIPGTDNGYGPMRTLTPEQAREVFRMLSHMPSVKLRERFVPKALDRASVYPRIWERDGEEGWEYIAYYYEVLRRCFAEATTSGDGFVLCIT